MNVTTRTTTDAAATGLGRGGRMSRQRKRDAVLRRLRGEDLELVSRFLGVTAATLSGWRDAFLAGGEANLATRAESAEALESERLKAKLGEMLLERELLEQKVAALEAGRPLMRRRSRRGAGPPRPAAASPTGWPACAGCGACRGPRFTDTGRRGARKHRGGEARQDRCRMRRWRTQSGPPFPAALSTAKATARFGRGCAWPGCGPPSAAFYV